jgi:hypothetical protein
LYFVSSELYGACGEPTKMARTVILGEDQQIVTVILHLLSYFIRCSEVFEQPVEQSPKNLTSYLKSLETELETCDLGKEVNLKINSKCDTINENSEELHAELEFENREISRCSEKISEYSKNFQALSITENVDSCGEDSGICSAEFDSSAEIPRNDSKNYINGFSECSHGSQNSENSSRSSTMCTKDSENVPQDVNICSKDSGNLIADSKRCPQDFDNLVQKDLIISDDKSISKKCEKCVEDCQNCIENSGDKIQQKPQSSCTEDKICGECNKILDKTSADIINTELCNCNGVFSGNSKEHKLWKSFLKSSCCIRNSRSLDRRCLSTSSMDSTTKPVRRCSSEKGSEISKNSKLCVQNNGEILSLDRQSIVDMFLSSYPLCPVCKGQLNFVDQDFARDSKNLESVCLCQDCDKVKSCSCQVIETGLGENERCASSVTVNSDDYSSGISSFEGERYSLSSLSVDSGLNEQCLQSSENLVGECDVESEAFPLDLPEAQ